MSPKMKAKCDELADDYRGMNSKVSGEHPYGVKAMFAADDFKKGFQACHDIMLEDMKKLISLIASLPNFETRKARFDFAIEAIEEFGSKYE